ncbi:MAG: AmmeMemoRadiSam system protein B [Gammaproteobacteria bacterium]|nr:AmmeMemoRadiSam system protein B [Gammaproteobacteria bacterium]
MLIHPNVAGKFYPANPDILRQDVLNMLSNAKEKEKLPIPKAIISPHAGYIYSGPIAASAYACLTKAKQQIKRVIIFAPSHQYPVDSIATTNADFYLTPLGPIEIDHKTISSLSFPYLNIVEEAFNYEHALEVHLPFLQLTLEEFSLIPFLVGNATPLQVEEILDKLWGGPETLIIISSDLSHYHPYQSANNIDKKTALAITTLCPDGFTSKSACGSTIIKGLLTVASKRKMHVLQVDLRNSGDTAGSKDSVVGYGSFHFK